MTRTVVWFSCGAASAIAAALTVREKPDAVLAYCHTGAEHEDNARFGDDVCKWLGKTLTVLRSDEYADTWDVWTKTRWLAGIDGARCTTELKVKPRLAWQKPDDIHVFGYTADRSDADRAERLRANYPELTIKTPLIERGLTKAACLAMLERAGIKPPAIYSLGFPNANCIPCVKATSPAYWALVRKRFPAEFNRMAALARELDVRLCRVDGERAFIDEIPADFPTTNPLMPSCDFLCHIAEQDMEAAE